MPGHTGVGMQVQLGRGETQSTAWLERRGPARPGRREAAAVSREHVMKGLTCQAQKLKHDLKQWGGTEGCYEG